MMNVMKPMITGFGFNREQLNSMLKAFKTKSQAEYIQNMK